MKWFATWIMNRMVRDGSSEWAIAMRREFDEMHRGHIGWAVGCVTVELKNRLSTEVFFVVSLILLPILAVIFEIVAVAGIHIALIRDWDMSSMAMILVPAITIIQFLFAFLLGKIRPLQPSLIVGAAGFILHQLSPALFFWLLFDNYFTLSWGVNMGNHFPIETGFVLSAIAWIAGVFFGAKSAREPLIKS